ALGSPRLLREIVEQRQRLYRRERVHVHLRQFLDDRMHARREERELIVRDWARARLAHELLALQQTQQLPRALEQRRGKSREPADLDPIRAIGATGFEAVHEEDAIADLAHGD